MKLISDKIKVKRRNRFWLRFFISYIFILLIPLSVFPLIYKYSYEMIKKREQDIRSLLVQECSSNMDTAIRQIDDAILSLEQNTDLKNLLYMKETPGDGSRDIFQIYKAQKEMSSLLGYANFTYNFSLYFNRADMVFDGSTFTFGRERYYAFNTSYSGMSYHDFEEQVLSSYHFQDVLKDTQLVYKKNARSEANYEVKDGILYLVSLPTIGGSRFNNLGTAVVHIDEDILNTLNYIPVSDHGCSYIEDKNHNMVYSILGKDYSGAIPELELSKPSGSFMATLQGEQSLITYAVSPYNGWRYISISPMTELTSGLITLRNLFYGAMLCVLIIDLVLCFRFTHNNAAPLEKILLSLQENEGDDEPEINSFACLEERMQHTIQNNAQLSSALEEQRIKLSRAFYEQLLDGSFTGSEELCANANYLGIDLNAGMYTFLLLSFGASESNLEEKTFSDKNIAQFFAEYLTLPKLNFRTQTHILSIDRLGILIFFPDKNEKKNRELLRQEFEPKLSDMRNRFPEEIRCCCGNFYTDLNNFSLSYNEALLSMNRIITMPPPDKICFYDALTIEPANYFYPPAIETKLKTLVSAGNSKGTEEFLNYIFAENLEKKSLSLHMLESFFMDMQTGIIRILQELKLNIYIHGLFLIRANTLDTSKECERIREAYRTIITELTAHPAGNDITAHINSYLKKNYGNCLMSVSVAAEDFHMSDSYFSTYFKKNIGQTFSKYLETLRINKACELIKNTDMNIEEISAEVGYSSSLSFRRAFKKVMGIPPSSYR